VSPDADGDKEMASTPPPDSPSPARISVDQILKPKPSRIERWSRSQSISERESLMKGPNHWKKQVFKDAIRTSTNDKRNNGHPIVSMVSPDGGSDLASHISRKPDIGIKSTYLKKRNVLAHSKFTELVDDSKNVNSLFILKVVNSS
jgi:hypothetical protein